MRSSLDVATSTRLARAVVMSLVILVAGLLAPAAQATPVTHAAVSAPTASPSAVAAKSRRPFFRDCHRSRKFNDRAFDFTVDAVLAGRCATTRIKDIKLISSYYGHSPSASHALDIMVNLQGSCSAGRHTGNRVARYFMHNARKHRVLYIIWKNSYWSASTRPMKWRHWRHGMAGGSCTTRHFDHVHVSFK